MTDYSELVKALRYCAESGDFNCNKDCPMYPNYPKCLTKMDTDAAAAIEELQAELNKKRTADCWGCKCEKVEPKRGEWILTNDEIETIRIHMNAIKEQLCNQYRRREAETYQTIVDKLAKMEVQE